MNQVKCPVCAAVLTVSPAKSRKAKKPKAFLMLVCPVDGRHFRGFISDQSIVKRVVDAAAGTSMGTGTAPRLAE
ncbi:MAG: hypothetical protein FJ317_06290 [SAR202 cluster bacterium]|nr:hypothetical protein [SAR202 cluster bacterium]